MKQSLKDLLHLIALISKKYESISQITGEQFNVFRILKMETSEVHLHSAFIAELLNPKGSHGQKNIFLKLFVKAFSIPAFEDEDDITGEVFVEEYKGKVDYESMTGGRLDIVIKTKSDKVIVIENKINAADQKSQLVRYKKEYPKAHLIYLTLDNKTPEDVSIENKSEKTKLELGKDFFVASYYTDVTHWLLSCRKEAVTHPILRETISQYLNLIKYLTGQTMIQEMQDDIVNVITSNGSNISASIEIGKSLLAAKKVLLRKFAEKLKTLVEKEITSVEVEISEYLGDKFQGIHFYLPNKINWLSLSFLTNSMQTYYLEVYNQANEKNGKVLDNVKYYRDKLEGKTNNWGKVENVEKAWKGDWVCRYYKLDNYFQAAQGWADIADDRFSIVSDVAKDVTTILKIMK